MTGRINRIDGQQELQARRLDRTGLAGGLSFAEVLTSRMEREAGVSFSAHAAERFRERGIGLEPAALQRLGDAVNRAETKGAADTLVLLDDMALIVNIPNRMVVTAMNGDTLREHVFTNIDSTIFA